MIDSLSQLLAALSPHVTHKPALAPLAAALDEFLARLASVRGEDLMREEEVMLRAIARAQREAERADGIDEEGEDGGDAGP